MCPACKKVREGHKIYDPPMSLQMMTTTSKFWNNYEKDQLIEEVKDKNKALRNETSIVDWYIAVLEDGNDTREVVILYDKLKKEHASLKTYTDQELSK